MKISTALILCAGFGKRLNPLTLETPKPLLRLNDITLLETCINTILKLGIKKISINTFYLGKQISEFIKKKNFSADIRIIEDGKKILNTGGGLLNNTIRVIPDDLCLNIDLSKIKTKPIFKWLKKNNIQDSEMLKTFNCGVGFCLISNKKNVKQIKKIFTAEYKPYEIGFISKEKSKIKTFGKIRW